MSHQYGPIGVQAYPEAVSTQQTMALPLSATNQTELMERLKQLRAWQQKQQADLLRQQQEQLLRLRSEQQMAMCGRAQNSTSTGEVWGDGQVRGREEGGFECLPESLSSVSDGQGDSGPDSIERVECADDVDESGERFDSFDYENQGEISPGSDSEEATNLSHVSML